MKKKDPEHRSGASRQVRLYPHLETDDIYRRNDKGEISVQLYCGDVKMTVLFKTGEEHLIRLVTMKGGLTLLSKEFYSCIKFVKQWSWSEICMKFLTVT